MKTFCLTLFVLLCLNSCSKSSTPQKPGTLYTLGNPLNWEEGDKSGVIRFDQILLSPLEGPNDTFRENVNVVLEKIPAGMSDEQYISASLQSVNALLKVSGKPSYTPVTINGNKGKKAHIQHKMGPLNISLDSYIFINSDTAIIISCSALDSTYSDKYKSDFEKVMQTFELN